MADFRPFPLNFTAPGWSLQVTLETAEPNMTIGNQYQVFGAAVDNAAQPPKPYALVWDDNGHFKLVEFAKLHRPTP